MTDEKLESRLNDEKTTNQPIKNTIIAGMLAVPLAAGSAKAELIDSLGLLNADWGPYEVSILSTGTQLTAWNSFNNGTEVIGGYSDGWVERRPDFVPGIEDPFDAYGTGLNIQAIGQFDGGSFGHSGINNYIIDDSSIIFMDGSSIEGGIDLLGLFGHGDVTGGFFHEDTNTFWYNNAGSVFQTDGVNTQYKGFANNDKMSLIDMNDETHTDIIMFGHVAKGIDADGEMYGIKSTNLGGVTPNFAGLALTMNDASTGGYSFDEHIAFAVNHNEWQTYQSELLPHIEWTVPGPGAVGLLGLAGVIGVGNRRRREDNYSTPEPK
jgi:hypothetical protein